MLLKLSRTRVRIGTVTVSLPAWCVVFLRHRSFNDGSVELFLENNSELFDVECCSIVGEIFHMRKGDKECRRNHVGRYLKRA